ncbi:MAG: hypothetical protein DWQ06_16015 [Calditrichaeota bacterium]|nr:MAG: hypothetical protein DWQ06_16015 [Calditrichota bacterium]
MFSFAFSQNKNEFEIQIPDSGTVQVLKTKDGSKFIGKVISFDDEKVLFETQNGNFEIKRNKIKSLENYSDTNVKSGEFFNPDPNVSRLFFAPKGKMLKKRKGYYQNIWLFFHNVTFGITDNITMGIGGSLFPEVDEQLYFFTPKIGKRVNKKFSVAGGVLGIKLPDDENRLVGIGYGVGTYELKKDVVDVTFGAGYGFVGKDLAEKPVFVLGLETRAGGHFALISENWIIPEFENSINSVGIRFFGEKLAVDLAFIFSITGDSGNFFPYLDFVYNF